MSGQHLLILYVEAEGIVWAEDQKSSNGTYINGKFARGLVELHTNDVITAGNTKLLFLGIPAF
jgi:pSer/pThr/pTyr-binding forkhead associated (FHA) protein